MYSIMRECGSEWTYACFAFDCVDMLALNQQFSIYLKCTFLIPFFHTPLYIRMAALIRCNQGWQVISRESHITHKWNEAIHYLINTLRPRQNGRHFPDDIFKRIFLNQNIRIPINISLEFVPKGPINNIPALVQIMAWRRPGDKPLSETMLVS